MIDLNEAYEFYETYEEDTVCLLLKLQKGIYN